MTEKITINENLIEKDITYLIEKASLNYLYGKDIYFSSGIGKGKYLLYQMIGNLGAFANDYKIDNSINIFIMSDSLYEEMRIGNKVEGLKLLERKLNSKGQPLKDILIITESALIKFIKKRSVYYRDEITQSLIDRSNKLKKNKEELSLF